jgi:hypothetical protein
MTSLREVVHFSFPSTAVTPGTNAIRTASNLNYLSYDFGMDTPPFPLRYNWLLGVSTNLGELQVGFCFVQPSDYLRGQIEIAICE